MVTASKPTIHCVSGDGAERYRVPVLSEEEDYRPAPDLSAIARQLQERHDATFSHLNECRIVFLWKREGGKSKGKERLGYCQKTSPLDKFLTGGDTNGADFIIWLGADNVAAMQFTRLQVEAICYHELLHIVAVEPEDDSEKVTYKPGGHDVEAFRSEIEAYGFWHHELRKVAETIRAQPSLFTLD